MQKTLKLSSFLSNYRGPPLSYRLKSESVSSPSITASLNIITPTGEATDPKDFNGLSTGAGFWGVSTSLNFSKSIDPAVVFFNIGYQHTFEEEQFGYNIQPGDAYNYGFGAGLSVNSLVAFSGRILGSYQKETKLNKKIVQGTISESVSLIWSMSYRLNDKIRIETTLSQGVSEDADNVEIGFAYIWNL
ncbi:MAG: transporter [Candidatus Thiodiazotropha sp. (ex Epidulcina cf. delphinae)]|nr:transporter [Candidatus Thiodiazotropha sp. (ex Epidulcina cf. delphinae)]